MSTGGRFVQFFSHRTQFHERSRSRAAPRRIAKTGKRFKIFSCAQLRDSSPLGELRSRASYHPISPAFTDAFKATHTTCPSASANFVFPPTCQTAL